MEKLPFQSRFESKSRFCLVAIPEGQGCGRRGVGVAGVGAGGRGGTRGPRGGGE